jgi:hypothetical protein
MMLRSTCKAKAVRKLKQRREKYQQVLLLKHQASSSLFLPMSVEVFLGEESIGKSESVVEIYLVAPFARVRAAVSRQRTNSIRFNETCEISLSILMELSQIEDQQSR